VLFGGSIAFGNTRRGARGDPEIARFAFSIEPSIVTEREAGAAAGRIVSLRMRDYCAKVLPLSLSNSSAVWSTAARCAPGRVVCVFEWSCKRRRGRARETVRGDLGIIESLQNGFNARAPRRAALIKWSELIARLRELETTGFGDPRALRSVQRMMHSSLVRSRCLNDRTMSREGCRTDIWIRKYAIMPTTECIHTSERWNVKRARYANVSSYSA